VEPEVTVRADDSSEVSRPARHRVRRRWLDQLVTAAKDAWPVLAAYAAIRIVSTLLVAGYLWGIDKGIGRGLTRYDGIWYSRIAENGYGEGLDQHLAFFPLYPSVVRVVDVIVPDVRIAALLVAWTGSMAAAWGLYAIGKLLRDRATGVMLVLVWAVLPNAILQAMAYTEGIFTALAAWTLYALLKRNWLVAGALCAVAGLSRPTAVALIAVVGVAALIAVFRRQDGWRPWVAGAIAPLGWLGYIGFVAVRGDSVTAWFDVQRRWGSSFDGGANTWRVFWSSMGERIYPQFYIVTLILLIAICLFVLSILDRQPWPLIMYSAMMLFLTLGGGGFYHSKARFLMPAFALLLPIAIGLVKTRPARAYVILGFLGLISVWYSTYLQVGGQLSF
jgi:hypothetical protein